ncbi:hypothetical protein 1 [Hubei diptera virus 12]|uniref:hypothetical protein 1 n=1 Tax=Hubei diptera virus 12 TaxID=1922873 RepID=UPI00090B56A2|nr:hypothetical protein 1 [Hubei diptera virus 12]APG75807.1 hypothetical protein 1 [Hubei diptera virus 12]
MDTQNNDTHRRQTLGPTNVVVGWILDIFWPLIPVFKMLNVVCKVCVVYALAVAFTGVYRLVLWISRTPAQVTMNVTVFVTKLFHRLVLLVHWPIEKLVELMFMEPEPEPIPLTWTETLLEGLETKIRSILPVVAMITQSVVVYIVGSFIASYLLYRLTKKPVKTLVMRSRGVYVGEAMREGSQFVPVKSIPPGQVSIMKSGLLTDSHIGYGLRVHDCLVTPAHVADLEKTFVLANRGVKVLFTPTTRIPSRVIPDLVYIPVEPSIWARLGATAVKMQRGVPKLANQVTCTGLPGATTGLLRSTTRMGVYSYSGSTLPGMSGAGYFVGNCCFGMHTGNIAGENVGIASSLIMREWRCIYKGESSPDFVDTSVPIVKKTWDDVEIDAAATKAWLEDEDFWEDRVANWGQKSFAENAFITEETVVKQQGNDGEEKVYRTTVVPSDLTQRVSLLEQAMAKVGLVKCAQCDEVFVGKTLEQHKKDHAVRHPCEQCDMVCLTVEKLSRHVKEFHSRVECDRCSTVCKNMDKLANHRKNCKAVGDVQLMEVPSSSTHPRTPLVETHPQVPVAEEVKESAFAIDSRKLVKNSPFLGQRQPSRTKNSKRSQSGSSLKVASPHSPSQGEMLSQILTSQKSMQESFERFLQVMVGQVSVTKQN